MHSSFKISGFRKVKKFALFTESPQKKMEANDLPKNSFKTKEGKVLVSKMRGTKDSRLEILSELNKMPLNISKRQMGLHLRKKKNVSSALTTRQFFI